MSRDKEPTYTHELMQVLVEADDLLDVKALRERLPHIPSSAMYTILASLRRYKAVDSVESGGRLWWFATPDTDTRLRVHEEMAPKDGPERQSTRGEAAAKQKPASAFQFCLLRPNCNANQLVTVRFRAGGTRSGKVSDFVWGPREVTLDEIIDYKFL